jgi:PAS domain S-box-containing protein
VASAIDLESRYRLLAENVSDVIWTLDLETQRFTFVSPSVLRLRGLTVEEAMAEPMQDSLTPESFAKAGALIVQHLAGGEFATLDRPQSITDVFDQPCRDGTIKHVEITVSLLHDEGGGVRELLGVSRDVTERVKGEAKQREYLAQLETALAEVRRLEGLIPICAHCKSVRDDTGYWSAVETYLEERAGAHFTHGICPTCLERYYPER